MKVLFVASEVAPFSKTGGLADVAGALPAFLAERGHDVRVVTPLHAASRLDRATLTESPVGSLGVPLGAGESWCRVLEGKLPNTSVPVYFLEHDRFWGRQELYSWQGQEYDDNAERFAFLSLASLQLARALLFDADAVHGHDWQAALLPLYLKTWFRGDPVLGKAGTVLTVHNIGYQGEFPASHFRVTGLPGECFGPGGLEFYGRMNFLKGGLLWADKVTAVSPAYAREMQTPMGGAGLDGACRARSSDVVGILNGLDYREWDPSTDKHLPVRFDRDDLAGKAACKAALQEEFGLTVDPSIPLVGIVSRLAHQKGLDVVAEAAPRLLAMRLQLAVLGTGEPWANYYYQRLPHYFPGRAGTFVGFDNGKAHRLYAGSDFFLMPSRYEPCGLGQMSALRYGSLPIVRAVGGLIDTVQQYDEYAGVGTGYQFQDLHATAVVNTVGWANSTWYDRPDHIQRMRQQAMAVRFDWQGAAERYESVYRWAAERR